MSATARKRPTRVLIIDDSATMRGLMAHVINSDPDLEVVGYAGDAYGAREAIKTLDPDVVTLDIEMPRMDGLTFLEKLMRLRPLPVVVVTSKTDNAQEIEYSALSLGAAHCLFKPSGMSGIDLFDALPQKIKEAVDEGTESVPQDRADAEGEFDPRKLVVLGASTGGVDALISVLRLFPEDCPPVAIVQHMPEKFISLFVQRLNGVCAPKVGVARSGDRLDRGQILVAAAGAHLRLSRKDPYQCMIDDSPAQNGFCPSVDVLFNSAAEHLGKRVVGGLLTGMGRDGAKGLKAIRDAGGATVAQDEATSVVYGMPRMAFECGAVDKTTPLPEISNLLLASCRTAAAKRAS